MSITLLSEARLVAGTGAAERPRKSRWPARLDLVQSGSGLLLALFMWGHMCFVSTILISKDAMWMVTKGFEGYFVTGRSYPLLVSAVVAVVLGLVVTHALVAMRKFPGNWQQWQAFTGHRAVLRHEDTTMWWIQALTGFALFFMATVHLYQMLMHPGDIGPHESAARVWNGWWPLYLVMLFAVELHGGIGLYRLVVKWGWFMGADPNAARRRLRIFKAGLTAFFLALGLLTLAGYLSIGMELQHLDNPHYVPGWLANPPTEAAPGWWPSWLAGPFRP